MLAHYLAKKRCSAEQFGETRWTHKALDWQLETFRFLLLVLGNCRLLILSGCEGVLPQTFVVDVEDEEDNACTSEGLDA